MLTGEECDVYRDFVEARQRHIYPLLASRMQRLGPSDARRILDAGVGPGFLTLECWFRFGAEISAVDINPAMLTLTRGLLDQNSVPKDAVGLRIADIHDLPFPDLFFDFVVSYSCFHHWDDPVRALRECLRVLAPGGTLLVVDTDRSARDVGSRFAHSVPDFAQARFITEAFEESWSLEEVRQLMSEINVAHLAARVEPFAFEELDIVGAIDRLLSFPRDDGLDNGEPVAWQLVCKRGQS